jgi:hypothetical protein
MANAYNLENPDSCIKLSSTIETLNPSKYKRYLIKQFKIRLNKVCDNQRCWVKQKFIKRMQEKFKNELEKDTFRPEGPQGKFTWLNTSNIDQVMHQYETKYPEFKFLGAVPIDFDDLPAYEIKNLDFLKLIKSGKSKIGVIFNTDEHYKQGTHWISLFADLNKGEVYYSDSYGVEPEQRIRLFMKRIARFIRDDLKKKPIVDYNKSECGMYSINFILRLLRGETFQQLTSNRMPDESVNECRQFYFT